MKPTNLKKLVRGAVPLVIGISLAGVAALAAGDGKMDGMKMPGMDMTAAASPLVMAVVVQPNPPAAGDNTLDIMVTDSRTGKAVTGLKFITAVAMTSMDMGTTRPRVKEMGQGHYKAIVNFSMKGPWRVALNGQGPAGMVASTLDFEAGGSKSWTPPAAASTDSGSMKTGDGAKMDKMDMKNGTMGNMKMDAGAPMDHGAPSQGYQQPGQEGHGSMEMGAGGSGISQITNPLTPLKEKGVYTAKGSEDWKVRTGFGHNAPMVGMMIQMMVEGSGMEHMKMKPMKMDFSDKNFTEGGGAAMAGMPGMKMDGGSMSGMKMTGPGSSASAHTGHSPSSSPTPGEGSSLKLSATLPRPRVGDNKLDITVMDANGQPVKGAKISASVAMTSMDMGTSHPVAKDMGNGHYMAPVNFSMAGPWRVSVKVAAPGQKAQSQDFDFAVK